MLALAPIASMNMVMTTPPALTEGGRAFAEKMPGVTAPFGLFDPAGCVDEASGEEIMLYREAELAHGRVAMMAAAGFVIQENFHPIFSYPAMDALPVIRQLDEVLKSEMGQLAGVTLLMAIWFSEFYRARTGWVEPDVAMRTLRDGYLPGDLGFDPMGLKPTDEAGFLAMQNKELNNGRLAMLAVAGMTAQELVTGAKLF